MQHLALNNYTSLSSAKPINFYCGIEFQRDKKAHFETVVAVYYHMWYIWGYTWMYYMFIIKGRWHRKLFICHMFLWLIVYFIHNTANNNRKKRLPFYDFFPTITDSARWRKTSHWESVMAFWQCTISLVEYSLTHSWLPHWNYDSEGGSKKTKSDIRAFLECIWVGGVGGVHMVVSVCVCACVWKCGSQNVCVHACVFGGGGFSSLALGPLSLPTLAYLHHPLLPLSPPHQEW